MQKFAGCTTLLAFFLAACAPVFPASGTESTAIVITGVMSTVIAEPPGTPPGDGPSPAPAAETALPSLPAPGLSPAELKYELLARFPDFFFCDPDEYPIAREDEQALALQRFSELQADREEFQVILDHSGLGGSTTFTDAQKLTIYREHKKLNAIFFEWIGDRYRFQIQTGLEGQQGEVIKGTIDGRGSVDVQERSPGFPSCPICLAAGTLIDTPNGAVPVENLSVGDPVWTSDPAGNRLAGVILQVGRVRVPSTHQMVHILLSDGRELWASPGHPTADRRILGDLKAGDLLDGAQIIHLERLPYRGGTTFDILPSGATGFYWANGILVDTTLKTAGTEK